MFRNRIRRFLQPMSANAPQAPALVPSGFAACRVALTPPQHAAALSVHEHAYRQAVAAVQLRRYHAAIYRRMFSVWN